mgnify:CR=1 FL=1
MCWCITDCLFNKKNKGEIMSSLLALMLKTLFTEKMIKKLIIILGEYLVKSSKNKLDDKVWDMVKAKLLN